LVKAQRTGDAALTPTLSQRERGVLLEALDPAFPILLTTLAEGLRFGGNAGS